MKNAGAIVFGKNNLVEMSYGLTGLNEHHGQVKNPYNKDSSQVVLVGAPSFVKRPFVAIRATGA